MAKSHSLTKGGKFDRRVRLRPSAANRQEAVDRIIWGLQERGVSEQNLECNRHYVAEFLAGAPQQVEGIFTPEISMFSIAFEYAMQGVLQTLAGQAEGWRSVALAVNYCRLGMAVDRSRREQKGLSYAHPCRLGDTPAFLWFLAVARCEPALVKPWSHYLYNLVSQRGLQDDFGDDPAFCFLWHMLRAECEGVWPALRDIDDKLEEFGPLLANVESKVSFSKALVEYLDYRLSRAFQYASPAADKPARDARFLFERQWMAVLPAELLCLRWVCRQLRGIDLTLDVEHPLLKTPMLDVPSFQQLPDDPLLSDIVSVCLDYFGHLWAPETSVALIKRERIES
ncbi:hypothetical protein [Caldimonas brevitalea]|uniref:hypothetical protein n=1 Tax=Caldimonas brevitalea TaxID=413882 RepID=UPI0012F9BF1D|nr:hypothetical protein [Caldimonas brevitalea]